MADEDSSQAWPDVLWVVRHGQSAGNMANAAAYAAGLETIDLPTRDVDVPLSDLGERQAAAVGRWFAAMPPRERPEVMLASPYLRARRTAEAIAGAIGLDTDGDAFVVDERLREKELGLLDGLTRMGIAARYPEQEAMRRRIGKFYYRPPQGENWCDVTQRLRSLFDTIAREYHGRRVLLVCHSAVILCLRYLLENLTEQQILDIDLAGDIANCAVTWYTLDPSRGVRGRMTLHEYNLSAPLDDDDTPVTHEHDARKAVDAHAG